MRTLVPLPDRLWRRVQVPDDPEACWEWQGATVTGYGVLGRGARHEGLVLAHRLAYALLVGPIPDAKPHIDHLCRNRRCVNPDHLEAVTQLENNRRARLAQPPITHCKRGHEFTAENTKWISNGGRNCRICLRNAGRLSARRRRAMAKESAA